MITLETEHNTFPSLSFPSLPFPSFSLPFPSFPFPSSERAESDFLLQEQTEAALRRGDGGRHFGERGVAEGVEEDPRDQGDQEPEIVDGPPKAGLLLEIVDRPAGQSRFVANLSILNRIVVMRLRAVVMRMRAVVMSMLAVTCEIISHFRAEKEALVESRNKDDILELKYIGQSGS